MVILALDTTTRGGSVALWCDGRIDERAGDPSRTHAERLPADLVTLLRDHGLRPADVDLYAVASGPGSFTGMRVGIATIQGLALVHDRLVVPVSALDALARGMAHLGRPFVGAWMDAYRGEVFAELYRVDGSTPSDPASLVPPLAAPPHHVVEQWGGALAQATGTRPVAGRSLAVGGDAVAAAAAALRDGFGPEVLLRDAPLLAGTIAAMAASRPEAAVRPHAIAPVYVRRPDAVVGRERRTASPAPPDVAPTR